MVRKNFQHITKNAWASYNPSIKYDHVFLNKTKFFAVSLFLQSVNTYQL